MDNQFFSLVCPKPRLRSNTIKMEPTFWQRIRKQRVMHLICKHREGSACPKRLKRKKDPTRHGIKWTGFYSILWSGSEPQCQHWGTHCWVICPLSEKKKIIIKVRPGLVYGERNSQITGIQTSHSWLRENSLIMHRKSDIYNFGTSKD